MFDTTNIDHVSKKLDFELDSTQYVAELVDQVCSDLEKKIKTYQVQRTAVADIAKRSSVNHNTIRRILSKTRTRIHHQTVYKLYQFLYGYENFSELVKAVPPVIKKTLLQNTPKDILEQNISYRDEVQQEIIRDSVFRKIYFKVCAGPFYKEEINWRHGEYGTEVLKKMITMGVINVDPSGRCYLGSNCAKVDEVVAKKAAIDHISDYFKTENADLLGQNYIQFHAEGLSVDGYNELIKMLFLLEKDWKERYNNDPTLKGDIKAFRVMCVDTIMPEGTIDNSELIRKTSDKNKREEK